MPKLVSFWKITILGDYNGRYKVRSWYSSAVDAIQMRYSSSMMTPSPALGRSQNIPGT